MNEPHGLRALDIHLVRALLQLGAALATVALSPALVPLALGPVLPAVLFAGLVLLATFWMRACWTALLSVLELISLQLEMSVYLKHIVPTLMVWGLTPLAVQALRHALLAGGLVLPAGVALAALLLSSGAVFLCALAVVIINRYVWRDTRGDVARGRAILERYTRAGHTTGLERLTTWLEWKQGRGDLWPDLLVRESYFPGIRLQPWHDVEEFEGVRELERHAGEILAELEPMSRDQSSLGPEATANPGMRQWQSLYLHRRREPLPEALARCPKTLALMDRLTGGVYRDSMLSVLGPQGRIALHQDPDNLFLTCHLGISVPGDCAMYLGGEARGWQEGRCVVFNSAFEHHCWNDSTSTRVVLLVDFLNPDFTPLERRFMAEYFAPRGQPTPSLPGSQPHLTAS